MSISSEPILVPEPMAADFRHLSLRDALSSLHPGTSLAPRFSEKWSLGG